MDYNSAEFRSYAACACVLVIKMLAMVPLTARQRFAKNVFISPEDAAAFKGKLKTDDPDVERVRRAHQNDLENIPIFLVTAWLYLMTGPSPGLAITLFRLFTGARIVHTLVYAVWVVRQPARALAFAVGLVITAYMAVRVIMYAM